MEFDKITVTADWEHIVGWQDGTTAARILWESAGGVSGRWTNRELAASGTLRAALTQYPLVSAKLLEAVTVQDLQVRMAPGNLDVVQVLAEVKTQRCTCADEVLYTVRIGSAGGTTVHGPMPGTDAEYFRKEPDAEVTTEPCPNPDYRPGCLGYIVEDEAYVRNLRAGPNPWHGQVYCQLCGRALWGKKS